MAKQHHKNKDEIISDMQKEAEMSRVKTFSDAYWALCKEHKLQIVQTPLSIDNYVPPVEETKMENHEETNSTSEK